MVLQGTLVRARRRTETARARILRIRATSRTDDPDTLAALFLADLGITGEPAEVLWHWVRGGVRQVLNTQYRQQAAARAAGRTVYDPRAGREVPYTGPVTAHKAGTTDGSTEFRSGPLSFLDAKVLIKGGYKQWRNLTRDDHQERIRIHGVNARAAAASIRSHEWALAELTAHGAGTLADIPADTLTAELPGFQIRT